MKISEIKYQRYDLDEVLNKIEEFMENFKNVKSAEEQLELEKEFYKYYDEILTASILVNIRYTQNTKDSFYLDEYKYIKETGSKIKLKLTELNKLYLDSKFIDDLRKEIPDHVFTKFENEQKIYKNEVVQSMIEESNVEMEYTNLMSNMTFDFDGKKMNPSKIAKYFQSENRNIRKGAYIAFGKAIKDKAKDLDDIYDRLVKIRDQRAKTLGFNSFTDVSYLALNRLDYNKDDITKFRDYVKKYLVPLGTKIKEKVKINLKLDDIMLYDNDVFTVNEPAPKGSTKEIFEKGLKMYKEMAPETAELFELMISSDAFDVESRDGKRGGGFCTSLPKYKLPYIHANFNGSMGDIKVLTHEFGHALAARNGYNYQSPHVRRYGMETAEVHSMSMEFLTYNWMNLFFEEDVNDYMFTHISKSITFIPYGTIVDYFQEKIYDNPDLSPIDRNKLWLSLEKEFLPHMSSDGIDAFEEGRRWQRQMHIYSVPFYYIDYCLAQVTAFQFLDLMQKDYNDALDKYLKFVKQAGTKTFRDLLKSVGLKSPFEEQTFIDIVNVVEKSLDL